jgi:hypothetical protein
MRQYSPAFAPDLRLKMRLTTRTIVNVWNINAQFDPEAQRLGAAELDSILVRGT